MNIRVPAEVSYQAARARQDQLIKPTGALGRLEDIACWFAACMQCTIPPSVKPAITVFAGDHGVAAQHVSAYPAEVTGAMLHSLANGQAAIAVLAREINALYNVVDVGVNNAGNIAGVFHEHIAHGTQDFSVAPAMSIEQAEHCLSVGAKYADIAIEQGANLLIAGEVGIGNTTAAACITAALTQLNPSILVGAGTGLNAAGREHKIQVVKRALQRTSQRKLKPLEILSEYGGFEIAAMCGYYLRSASRGVPMLLDGYISAAAAMIAVAMEPACKEWMQASHQSAEIGHALSLEHLQLKPLLSLGMRLGEGTGAAVAIPLIQSALSLHRDMATFAEAGVPNA